MPRERAIKAVSVNVVAHPHGPEVYARLLQKAAAKVGRVYKAFRVHGDRFGMMTGVGKPAPDGKGSIADGVVGGTIVTFTQVNIDGPWADISTGDVADESKRAEIVIPSTLRPNRVAFRFRFFLKNHQMVVESKNDEGSISPRSIAKLLGALFSQERIVEEFGEIEVTVLPDKEALAKILSSRIKKICLRINTPNPGDDTADEELAIEKRLERMAAKQTEETFTAKAGATISPDDELRAHARVAARNGYVAATVLQATGHRTKKVSTQDHPHVGQALYDPNAELAVSAFERLAQRMHDEQKG